MCVRGHGVLSVHTAAEMADGGVKVVSVCEPRSWPDLGVPLCTWVPVGGAGEAGCDWALLVTGTGRVGGCQRAQV